MIIKSTPDDYILPHRKNIFDIHRECVVTNKLDTLNPTYAGGYPLALFAAPRWKTNKNKLCGGYYRDLDVYPTDICHYDALCALIEVEFSKYITHRHVTEYANSYVVNIGGRVVNVQIMAQLFGPPEEIIGKFDFVNVAIAFTPKNEAVYFHKDLITYHTKSELQVLSPWMLDDRSERASSHRVTQLLRFKKYCDRWSYKLSEGSLLKLMSVYREEPEIFVAKGSKHKIGSSNWVARATHDTDLWRLMTPYLTTSPYWDDDMDTHGHLTNNYSNTVKDSPLPKDDWWHMIALKPVPISYMVNTQQELDDDIPF